MTVLNIDDDPDDLDIFCEVIESIDPKMKCLTAQSTDAAMQLLDEIDAPDYIFIDVNMPIKNGKECLKEIRRRPKLSKVPVVILSTSKNIPDRNEYEKFGATFLVKVPTYLDLVESVKKVISK